MIGVDVRIRWNDGYSSYCLLANESVKKNIGGMLNYYNIFVYGMPHYLPLLALIESSRVRL